MSNNGSTNNRDSVTSLDSIAFSVSPSAPTPPFTTTPALDPSQVVTELCGTPDVPALCDSKVDDLATPGGQHPFPLGWSIHPFIQRLQNNVPSWIMEVEETERKWMVTHIDGVLFFAVRMDDAQMIRDAVEAGANINSRRPHDYGHGMTALMYAAIYHCETAVTTLLQWPHLDLQAADVQGKSAASWAKTIGASSIQKYIELALKAQTLHVALAREEAHAAACIVNEVQDRDRGALWFHALKASCNMGHARHLLTAFQVANKSEVVNAKDPNGVSLLIIAALAGNVHAMLPLMMPEVDLFALAGDGRTALSCVCTETDRVQLADQMVIQAARYGNLEGIRQALEAGGCPDTIDAMVGLSALHFAIFGGFHDVVTELLNHGATVLRFTEQKYQGVPIGMSCVQLAERLGDPLMVQLVRSNVRSSGRRKVSLSTKKSIRSSVALAPVSLDTSSRKSLKWAFMCCCTPPPPPAATTIGARQLPLETPSSATPTPGTTTSSAARSMVDSKVTEDSPASSSSHSGQETTQLIFKQLHDGGWLTHLGDDGLAAATLAATSISAAGFLSLATSLGVIVALAHGVKQQCDQSMPIFRRQLLVDLSHDARHLQGLPQRLSDPDRKFSAECVLKALLNVQRALGRCFDTLHSHNQAGCGCTIFRARLLHRKLEGARRALDRASALLNTAMMIQITVPQM